MDSDEYDLPDIERVNDIKVYSSYDNNPLELDDFSTDEEMDEMEEEPDREERNDIQEDPQPLGFNNAIWERNHAMNRGIEYQRLYMKLISDQGYEHLSPAEINFLHYFDEKATSDAVYRQQKDVIQTLHGCPYYPPKPQALDTPKMDAVFHLKSTVDTNHVKFDIYLPTWGNMAREEKIKDIHDNFIHFMVKSYRNHFQWKTLENMIKSLDRSEKTRDEQQKLNEERRLNGTQSTLIESMSLPSPKIKNRYSTISNTHGIPLSYTTYKQWHPTGYDKSSNSKLSTFTHSFRPQDREAEAYRIYNIPV